MSSRDSKRRKVSKKASVTVKSSSRSAERKKVSGTIYLRDRDRTILPFYRVTTIRYVEACYRCRFGAYSVVFLRVFGE